MGQENDVPGVYRKVQQVMERVEDIPKTGRNEHFGYDYHEADVVMSKLRPIMAEVGLVVICGQDNVSDQQVNTRSGTALLTTVDHTITVVDVDDGSSFSFPVKGRGQDNADKGPMKAYTMAYKYGVMKLFGIAAGETDPDASGSQHTGRQGGQNGKQGGQRDHTCIDLDKEVQFGKHEGKTWKKIIQEDLDYIRYLAGQEDQDLFCEDDLQLIAEYKEKLEQQEVEEMFDEEEEVPF